MATVRLCPNCTAALTYSPVTGAFTCACGYSATSIHPLIRQGPSIDLPIPSGITLTHGAPFDPTWHVECRCGHEWEISEGLLVSAHDPRATLLSLLDCRACASRVPGAGKPEARLDGELLGFRIWALQGHELCSSNADMHAWTIGVNKAECLRTRYRAYWEGRSRLPEGHSISGAEVHALRSIPPDSDHHAPEAACGCGLYAVFGPWDNAMGRFQCHGPKVYGAIAAWGKLGLQPEGFRAEYARVVALAVGSPEYHRVDPAGKIWVDREHEEHADRVRSLAEEFGVVFCRREELLDVAADFGELVPDVLKPSGGGLAQGGFIPPSGLGGATVVAHPLHPVASGRPMSGAPSSSHGAQPVTPFALPSSPAPDPRQRLEVELTRCAWRGAACLAGWYASWLLLAVLPLFLALALMVASTLALLAHAVRVEAIVRQLKRVDKS